MNRNKSDLDLVLQIQLIHIYENYEEKIHEFFSKVQFYSGIFMSEGNSILSLFLSVHKCSLFVQ